MAAHLLLLLLLETRYLLQYAKYILPSLLLTNGYKMPKVRSNESDGNDKRDYSPNSPNSPTTRLAVTTAMTSSANNSGKERYPFHIDAKHRLDTKDIEQLSLQSRASPIADNQPVIRLGQTASMTTGGESGRNKRYPFSKEAPPNVRLAHVPGAQGDNVLLGRNGVERMSDTTLPALLVSYYYLDKFIEHQDKYCYRDWVMDSGAFSAHSSGVEINLQEYINCCKLLMECDPTLTEIYALDVIGDYGGTRENTEEMWKQGVPAIPCFHYGEPWKVLEDYCAKYPKVAIGGCVGKRDKHKFAAQCFARQWPHKFHGFGFGTERDILGMPFHSSDATNWELTVCLTGNTLISTTDGLITIRELVDKKSFSVNTYNQIIVSDCKAVNNGIRDTITLLLDTGQYLTSTPDHKVLSPNGWIEVGKLESGDRIRMIDKQLRIPEVRESIVDEMLGWITGDGFYCSTHRRNCEVSPDMAGIAFAIGNGDNDEEAMEKLMPVWDEFVGTKNIPQIQSKINTQVVTKSTESWKVMSKLYNLGFKEGIAIDKSLPTYIFSTEPYKQLAFLRGLFSADGSVGKYPNGMYNEVRLASNSRTLLEQVQILLLEFGIQSRSHWYKPPDKRNEQGQLVIGGISAVRYMEIIGFNLSHKTNKFGTKDNQDRKSPKWTYKHKLKEYAVVKEIIVGSQEEVYDIIMPVVHHFVANGLVVHNCGYGRWRAFGGAKLSVRGSSQNLRAEVLWYLDLEERARKKWRKEMLLLEELFPIEPLYRGPMITNSNTASRVSSSSNIPSIGSSNPTIRLAESGMGSYDSERQKGKLYALNPNANEKNVSSGYVKDTKSTKSRKAKRKE